MERVDLRLIEYFIAVAEELHFGRAAERLHIAQPSLSRQIRRLEAQLRVSLLERNSRNVHLTPAGQALLQEGRKTLSQAQRAFVPINDADPAVVSLAWRRGPTCPAVEAFIDASRRVAANKPGVDANGESTNTAIRHGELATMSNPQSG